MSPVSPTPSRLNALLAMWRAEPTVGGNVSAWKTIPARAAQGEPLPEELNPALAAALRARGITQLYTHQAQAWRRATNNEHVVVVTGTASGKTLAYNLPVLQRLMHLPESRALYLFPTKALAQDQQDELAQLNAALPEALRIPAATYDGDTTQSARPAVRQNARILISNPDMLHTGILPHHTKWAEFFARLEFVVLDEAHTYRGVFGSHVANVVRRLKRVAAFYGARPQFLLASATIANPIELAGGLVEETVTLVNEDGAPRGPKHFVIYNPPVVNEDLGIRRSVLQESVRLAADLLAYDVQTIVFGRARRGVEVMLNYLREASGLGNEQVRGYRSGYLPRQRREIEAGLRAGTVRAVVSTNALELGIDIGGMEAAVLAGYPGTIAATWQQAGRAGRTEEPALAALVTSANPLDQFLARHPDFFFGASPEQALINPDNLLILLAHLRCAAFELPFGPGEGFGRVPPEVVEDYLHVMEEGGEIHRSGGKSFWMASEYPAQGISLRSASPNTVVLQAETEDGWRVVGEVDEASADALVHPQAVYLHEGQQYVVESLDLEQYVARLKPAAVDYYTEPSRESTVTRLETKTEEPRRGARAGYGELSITSQVTGYQKIEWHTHARLGMGPLEMPLRELQTTGYWLALDEATVDALREAGVWRSSVNDYGKDWKRITTAVRERDNYTCQVCGAKESGRAHDVHHKTPFRAFARAAEANRLENLITLCPSCHRRAETVVKVRTGLGGLAYALGHLAPLFLMCDTADLGVHSDPASPITEGAPTVVVYDQIPAGIGFSERLFELHDEIMLRAWELVAACECADGCPSCVGPGGEQGEGGKTETLAMLAALKAG
ncbi:MAG: DEAD/DEAH box helicase [Chloroflexi bacterium]|nr:DEAD/DEAH box helicase [Chloroflexota bacterium]